MPDREPKKRHHLPPALRLLSACSIRPESCRDVRLTPAEWEGLAPLAVRHGLGVVLERLIAAGADAPASVRELVAQTSTRRRVLALDGMRQLLEIVRQLSRERVPAVALKGPALSLWLYGDLGSRSFNDLDILVPPACLPRALEALRTLGFTLPEGMSPRTARHIYGSVGACPLRRDGSLPVDLHWRLAANRFRPSRDPAAVIAASMPLRDSIPDVRVPSPGDAAVLLLTHAAKHVWSSLEMLLAVATLMQRDDIEWEWVEACIRRGGTWRGAAATLLLASTIFDVPVPAAVPDSSLIGPSDALRRQALEALTLPAGVFPDRWRERRTHRAALDTRAARLRYDAARLLAPTPLEWHWCPLPERLAPLYPCVRLARLALAPVQSRWRAGDQVSGRAAAQAAPGDGARPSIRGGPG